MALSTSNLTSGFVDLATYDEIEKYMYGGPDATAYFVRETRKATWFTQVPVALSRSSGTAEFGQDWSANISRAGDYLLYSWLRVTIPAVTVNTASFPNLRARWTRNLMHNLIQQCQITFNDLVAEQFDNYFLDFWAAFTVPAGKRNGYNNMVGNIPELINSAVSLPQVTLNLPLPFFYTRDSGVALPTAALPYNEMKVVFKFREWYQLLIIDNLAAAAGTNPSSAPLADASQLSTGVPKLINGYVWSNYAIVSNDERKRMACAPRDILMEQAQIAPFQSFNPSSNPTPQYDIRFSHAIKVIFFGVRNKTTVSQWSNYTAAQPLPGVVVDFNPPGAVDPLEATTLIYENTARLGNGSPDGGLGSDYFALVNPWYHAPVIPLETGYHMYSYSLDFYALDPIGSTNYGKLTNVSIGYKASPGAIAGASGLGGPGSGSDYPQTYEAVVLCVNNNIIRISGGALGFPVL